ncbi:MAG: hypothetical protein ACI4J7_01840 [Ruminiclostridium sp.]
MQKEIKKVTIKVVIIGVIIAAVIFAAVIAVKVLDGTFVEVKPQTELIETLKPGKYYLETTSGLDNSRYVEVFPDQTLMFVGTEEKEDYIVDGQGLRWDWNQPVRYELSTMTPFIGLESCDAEGNKYYSTGMGYFDENHFYTTFQREGNEDIADYNFYPNEPDRYKYEEDKIIGRYVYAEE